MSKIKFTRSDTGILILIPLLILNFRVANGDLVQRIFLAKFHPGRASPQLDTLRRTSYEETNNEKQYRSTVTTCSDLLYNVLDYNQGLT